ncbi:hypothetical protein CR513_12498, partial [Mucuna pruriens]
MILKQIFLDNNRLKQFHYPSPQARNFELDEELLQTFRKVEINTLFLEAIKQISKYAKFLKE